MERFRAEYEAMSEKEKEAGRKSFTYNHHNPIHRIKAWRERMRW